MRRLTTPTCNFYFSTDPETEFSVMLVTFAINKTILFEKNKSDLTFSTDVDKFGKTRYVASCVLTQQETKQFPTNPMDVVEIQIRVGGNDRWYASKIYRVNVGDVLNQEVLSE